MKIWKWEIKITDHQVLMLPAGAKILDVQMQGDKCCLWALCDENAVKAPRNIAIYGTGNPVPDNPGEYLATFQMLGGSLVFHAFEVDNEYQLDIENKINAACCGLGLSREQVRDAIKKRMESSFDTLEDVLKGILSMSINLKDYCD